MKFCAIDRNSSFLVLVIFDANSGAYIAALSALITNANISIIESVIYKHFTRRKSLKTVDFSKIAGSIKCGTKGLTSRFDAMATLKAHKP